MYFKRQFESFDPLTGQLPYSTFSFLPEIAFRARERLKSRTTEQITLAAINISKSIRGYFKDKKHGAIVELQRNFCSNEEALQEYFEWVGQASGGGCWVFKDSMAVELDIPTEKNTSEVGALKSKYSEIKFSGFFQENIRSSVEHVEAKDYELFAVLALWLLSDALHHINKPNANLSLAGMYALKAMDAVCYSEKLYENAVLKDLHAQSMSESAKNLLEEWERKKHEQQSEQAKQMNIKRHEETYKARALAIGEWQNKFSPKLSSEKAGLQLSDWLEEHHKLFYEPRTITGWIRAHKKAISEKNIQS